MAGRFFPNEMPEFVAESAEEEDAASAARDSLGLLLRLPYQSTVERFLRAGLDLKDKVVAATWADRGRKVRDYTLYTGPLGTAYLLLRSYQATNSRGDLQLCAEIAAACDAASHGSDFGCPPTWSSDVTFISGRAGVCAIGAVAAKYGGDETSMDYYLSSFRKIRMPRGVPNELLYGRAGYLWSCLYLNKHLGGDTVPADWMAAVAKEILLDGRTYPNKGQSPLMYEWYGEKYWGAAHGLAGIMHVLMDMKLKPEEQSYVQYTLKYMIRNRFPSGNYPASEESKDDKLVHWCHGAPGVVLTLTKAAEVFQDEEFLRAAADAAEVVWSRGLLRRVGICHGVSGNTYVFLSLYRMTGRKEYLYKAKAFACFLLDKAVELIRNGQMHSGDHPYSLFEGLGGMASLFIDMVKPLESRFPAYEL